VSPDLAWYGSLLGEIKARVSKAQAQAALSANAQMIAMYWDIGTMIHRRQRDEGWGAGVISRLAADLKSELSEVKGFSERNLKYMVRFAREYGTDLVGDLVPSQLLVQQAAALFGEERGRPIVQQAAAQLSMPLSVIFGLPWFHHIVLLEKVRNPSARAWYACQALEQGWSRDALVGQIRSQAHERGGTAVTNFTKTLPAVHADLAQELLKDPYLFDFLTIEEPFHERELETNLVRHLEKFLLELGAGFAFVGRQYHLVVSDRDFYLDLLFYHLKLRCFIVIELKKGDFRPEYAGKMNFYCSVVDDQLRNESDNSTVGLILCQTKDRILAEYTLRDMQKPIGISEYELTRSLPEEFRSALPTVEEIEAELDGLGGRE